MNTKEKVILAVCAIFVLMLGFFALSGDKMSTGAAYGPVTSATLATVNAGPQSSVTVLAQQSNRRFAVFSLPVSATNSVQICLSATCSSTTGITVGVSTSSPSFFVIDEQGLPYTGIVTAYAVASGTKIMVTSN